MDRLGCLANAEFRIYSQFGEDGIIEWLISHLPNIPRVFVEFGVEDYAEANTRFLVRHRGWRGLVMDGSAANIAHVRADPIHVLNDITPVEAFVTAENIDALLVDHGLTGEIGILSVDIDGNDYWVLDAIKSVSPAILIVEYNAIFGDLHDLTIPYDPSFERFSGHFSGQYYGASLGAFKKLAAAKGYQFVGTNSAGVNAFFIRDNLALHIKTALDTCRAWPSRHRDSRDETSGMSFVRGTKRADLILDTPVIDLLSGQTRLLSDLGPLYSDQWLREM
ncbi:hypothetical protein [Ruegeria sp. 6PALISEP08]|uniref:hypothetical protein n=1 Tax=Ruegeria sp. 6PALISEP08 TaxID=1225660 RepID=UPI0012ED2E8F|nr:hypothetical protein [Ruegeria sp. 6PALISEP08]